MAQAPGGQHIPQITETVDSVAIQARIRIIEGILKTQPAVERAAAKHGGASLADTPPCPFSRAQRG